MSNREHMMGYTPACGRNFRELRNCVDPFPLGVPKRVIQEHRERAQQFAKRVLADVLPKKIDPMEQVYLQPSDVPGVLLAADPADMLASLDRIEMKRGTNTALDAHARLVDRATRDGYPEALAALIGWKHARSAKAKRAIDESRDRAAKHASQHAMQMQLMQQSKAACAAAQGMGGFPDPLNGSIRDELERAWQDRVGITAGTANNTFAAGQLVRADDWSPQQGLGWIPYKA